MDNFEHNLPKPSPHAHRRADKKEPRLSPRTSMWRSCRSSGKSTQVERNAVFRDFPSVNKFFFTFIISISTNKGRHKHYYGTFSDTSFLRHCHRSTGRHRRETGLKRGGTVSRRQHPLQLCRVRHSVLRMSVKKCVCVWLCVYVYAVGCIMVGWMIPRLSTGKLLQDQRHQHVLPLQVFGDAGTVRRRDAELTPF